MFELEDFRRILCSMKRRRKVPRYRYPSKQSHPRYLRQYYWDYLEMLWNPPSKYHWTKTLIFLRHFTRAEKGIPPRLILRAALHGMIHLIRSKTMKSPDSPAWLANVKMDSLLSEAFVIRFLKLHFPLYFQLDKYSKLLKAINSFAITTTLSDDNEVRWLCSHNAVDLKAEKRDAIDVCQQLHLMAAPAIELQRARLVRDMALSRINLCHIPMSEAGNLDICSICLDPILDEAEYIKVMHYAAATLPSLTGAKRTTRQKREPWSEDLAADIARCKNQHKSRKCFHRKALWDIAKAMSLLESAYYRLKDVQAKRLPKEFCLMATKLACGHVFGYTCITE
jgi:hypothetical protein